MDSTDFKFQLFFNRDNVIESLVSDCANLTLLCLNAENLRSALNLYIKYRGLVGNTDKLSLQNTENGVSFAFFHEYPNQVYEFVPMINFIFIISFIEHYLADSDTALHYQVKTKSKKIAHWR